jgi:DNA-binding transcriptional LysR family regulator
MASLPGLDIDLLRSFVLVAAEGSFTRAAEHVGRTQSAVSLQIQRLEALVGHRVLLRGKGGAVQLTPQGRYLLGRAQEMLTLNDEILAAVRVPPPASQVRIGLPDEFYGFDTSAMLAGFSAEHPEITVEAFGAPSCALVPLISTGDLDLMVCEAGIEPPGWHSVELWRGGLHWITSTRDAPHLADPLPLSLPPEQCPWRPAWMSECLWRGGALRALERAGRRYRIVATSPNLFGMKRPVLAGAAITIATLPGLAEGLRALGPEEGLPPLPDAVALLLKAREARQPGTNLLAGHLAACFREVG